MVQNITGSTVAMTCVLHLNSENCVIIYLLQKFSDDII